MSGVNKVILVGRLGKTPELRQTQGGTDVCTFSLATSEKYKDKETTEWHNVVVWGNLAKTCSQYLDKGREVYIEGKIQTRSWDDKDGIKKYKTEIIAQSVTFLGGKSQGNSDGFNQSPAQEQYDQTPLDDSDLPF